MTDQQINTADGAADGAATKGKARFAKLGKYAGIAAFMFFFIKGLVWLAIGGLALWGVAG